MKYYIYNYIYFNINSINNINVYRQELATLRKDKKEINGNDIHINI